MWAGSRAASAEIQRRLRNAPPYWRPSIELLIEASISPADLATLVVADFDRASGILRWHESDTGLDVSHRMPEALRARLCAVLPDAPGHAPLLPWLSDGRFETELGPLDETLPIFATAEPTRLDGSQPMTRDCTDPWHYLEVSQDGRAAPCCRTSISMQSVHPGQSGDQIRNSGAFRRQRRMLATGRLHRLCRDCHIRQMVPVSKLHSHLAGDPAAPGELRELRIDVTGRCNLRCTYCAVSAPGYDGRDIDPQVLATALPLIRQMPPGAMIHVNGHGETTYHPQWAEFGEQVLAGGHRPHIITNLALNYSDAEIALLARFATIQVSLDSHDQTMMRRIRKAVSIARVFANIERIREAADQQGLPAPHLAFSIGLYDPSIWTLPGFLDELIARQIRSVTFWNLLEYPHQQGVTALPRLSAERQAEARTIIATAADSLRAARITFQFAGDFADSEGRSMLPAG